MKKIISVLIACISVIALAGCGGDSNEHEGEAKTPSGSSVQKGRDYQEVIDNFEEKGFINIKTEKLEDLITGWIIKDGEVESVSVDGNKDYSPDDWYSNNVEVVITYHTFPADDEKTESTTSTSKEKNDIQEDKDGESAKELLEATFPVENAKRSAVVAITNYYAMDVYADRSTVDVSKFHSYADTTGNVDDYFFKVNSWGTWSEKNEKIWHVDSLILERTNGLVTDVALDVRFDGTNYVISNIIGTYGNPGVSAENAVNLSEMESGSNASIHLTVPPELIKNDRNQAEVEVLDHSDDLDKYVARTAFEKYGKTLSPYGFKCHWIIDLRNEEQTSEGSWIFKVGVTITNQYGTKVDAVAEGIISGTTENPVVGEFSVY